MSTAAYPLQWPAGWARTPPSARESGSRFKTMGWERSTATNNSWRTGMVITLDVARRKLFAELDRMVGVSHVVLSSNVPLRSDGMPRADAARYRMEDPGVALYFMMHGHQLAMACDRFETPAANVRSLGLAIEAMRQLERHGGGAMMERAFSGFTALPAPKSCWEVLGLQPGASEEAINRAFRAKASSAHPDVGGSHNAMAELNRARDEALRSAAA